MAQCKSISSFLKMARKVLEWSKKGSWMTTNGLKYPGKGQKRMKSAQGWVPNLPTSGPIHPPSLELTYPNLLLPFLNPLVLRLQPICLRDKIVLELGWGSSNGGDAERGRAGSWLKKESGLANSIGIVGCWFPHRVVAGAVVAGMDGSQDGGD